MMLRIQLQIEKKCKIIHLSIIGEIYCTVGIDFLESIHSCIVGEQPTSETSSKKHVTLPRPETKQKLVHLLYHPTPHTKLPGINSSLVQ